MGGWRRDLGCASAWIVVVVVFVVHGVIARWLRINNIIRSERAEKQVAWQRVKSKVMTEEARIIIVSW